MPYSIKSLLTPHEDRLASQLKTCFGQSENSPWTILYKVRPSTLINPDLVGDVLELKTACLEGLSAFAIVERKPN
jgi:hypothetical protein